MDLLTGDKPSYWVSGAILQPIMFGSIIDVKIYRALSVPTAVTLSTISHSCADNKLATGKHKANLLCQLLFPRSRIIFKT